MGYKRALAVALMLAMLLGFAAHAESKYYIDVDIANQIVTAYCYGGGRGEDNIARQMICSTGYGTRTPTGTYFMPEKKYESERQEWYWFGEYEIYAKYASRIVNGILFHSVLYPNTHTHATWASVNALGFKASHGCVRLRDEDAKWIAENCPPGTCVHIFDDAAVDEDLRQLLRNASFSADEMDYADFLRGMCTLSRGSRFTKVTELQQVLIDAGYLDDRADGIFGPRTEAAVMAWQADSGLEATGIVTPEQLETILSGIAPAPTATPDPTAEPTATATAKPTATPTVKPTATATAKPTATPTVKPTATPTAKPTATPTVKPTATATPTAEPTATPSPNPTAEPTPMPTPDISKIPGTVALVRVESKLNLRERPSVKSAVLVEIPAGAAVQVLQRGPEWSQIIYGDQTGWVDSDYIEIVRN